MLTWIPANKLTADSYGGYDELDRQEGLTDFWRSWSKPPRLPNDWSVRVLRPRKSWYFHNPKTGYAWILEDS